jgi:hypothetical protein
MQSGEIKMQACAACASETAGDQSATSTEASFIYALGQIEARFPRLAVEKEFAQATARTLTNGQTDTQAFHSVLAEKENRYLARELCWVFMIQGLEAYILKPREHGDLDLLIQAVAPKSVPSISAVIGVKGPNASPEQCNGLMAPVVVFDQIYTFDTPSLVTAIPKPDKMTAKAFEPAAQELFERLMLMTDNAGATDEHRALNYLAMRYPAIYTKVADRFAEGYALSGVDTNLSTLSGARTIIDVVFKFTNRTTDYSEKFFTRVDVAEEYPFLVTKLSPYYDR